MKKELECKLIKICPQYFIEGLQFACLDGWFELLDTLLNTISSYVGRWTEVCNIKKRLIDQGKNLDDYKWIEKYFKENPKDPLNNFKIVQVKEKFGGLRFYTNISPYEVRGMIRMAEMMSYKICEKCGNSGETRGDLKWVQTLCKNHYTRLKDV